MSIELSVTNKSSTREGREGIERVTKISAAVLAAGAVRHKQQLVRSEEGLKVIHGFEPGCLRTLQGCRMMLGGTVVTLL